MGTEEYARPVRGSGGRPIQTSSASAIETNNYKNGGGINLNPANTGESYPLTIDPAFDIEVLHITGSGDIEAEITTVSGNIFTIPLNGGTGVIDWFSMDSITFKDPNATGAKLKGSYGGD